MRVSLWFTALTVFSPAMSLSFTKTRQNYTEVPRHLIPDSATYVSLSYNLLTVIGPDFQNLTILTNVDLSRNQIHTISAQAFVGTRLERLTLSYNRLSRLPVLATVGATLKYITATNNVITALGSEELGRVTGIKSVQLSRNQLASVAPDALVNSASTLESFNAGINRITHMAAEFFTDMESLSTLNLQSNRLQAFPSFTQLPVENSMRSLSMNNNQCGDLAPDALHKLNKLNNIALASNGLTRIPDISRQRETLTSLYLGANAISQVPHHIFVGFKLRILNLNNNRYTGLPNLLPLNQSLTNLYVDRSSIGPVPCQQMLHFLTTCDKLSYLHINDVGLETFPDISLLNRPLSTLRLLNSGTMHCDCAMAWMKNISALVSSTDVQVSSKPCASPPHLTGRTWGSITIEELCSDNDAVSCSSTASTATPPTTDLTTTPTIITPTTPTTNTTTTTTAPTTTTSRTTAPTQTTHLETSTWRSTSVEPTVAATRATTGNGINLPVAVGIPLGGLLLVAIIVICLMAYKLRRRRPPPTTGTDTTPACTSAEYENPYQTIDDLERPEKPVYLEIEGSNDYEGLSPTKPGETRHYSSLDRYVTPNSLASSPVTRTPDDYDDVRDVVIEEDKVFYEKLDSS